MREIEAAGGTAVANADNVGDFAGAEALEFQENHYPAAAAALRRLAASSDPAVRAPALARLVAPAGIVALEVGHGQAKEVASLLVAAALEFREVRADLSGIERVVLAGSRAP